MTAPGRVSIVILTHNRKEMLVDLLCSLSNIRYRPLEIIVVDNHSTESPRDVITNRFPRVHLIEMEKNIGVGARNRGISSTSGEIIITLDDDVIGIDDNAIHTLREIFERDPVVGAVCFKVVDPDTGNITNWCHHYRPEEYSMRSFVTNEISEGAVAYRKAALDVAGVYPENFFISHEGPDLACRIMNHGYNIIFCPGVIVRHCHSSLGRVTWRRYYYDTRNLIWLAVRNYPVMYALKVLFIGIGSQCVYAIRDGHLRYWVRGVLDGIRGIKDALSERCVVSDRTMAIINEINKERPGFMEMARKRLFHKGIRI